MSKRHYIIYDGRAMAETDDATALEAGIGSLAEAKESAPDYGGAACWSYRERGGQLTDERFEFYGFPEEDGSYTIITDHRKALEEIERRINS